MEAMKPAESEGSTKRTISKIRRILFKSRPDVPPPLEEEELIQSLKEISEESNQSLVSHSHAPHSEDSIKSAWSLSLAENSGVKARFSELQKTVDEYNVVASQEKWDLVRKNECSLEKDRALAEQLQKIAFPETERKGIRRTMKAGMQQFCKSTLHYATVMDALVQHHPEWVSLAWGTMKLLLSIPIEYEKTKEGIVINLGRIGGKLQLVSLLLRFFPKDKIVDAACAIYASIADFLAVSICRLRNNRLVRIFKATLVPFDTRMDQILTTIDENYALLKEQVEMQWLISDFERHLQTQNDLSEVKKTQCRVLAVLEDLVQQDYSRRQRELRAVEGSQAVDRWLLRPPKLEIVQEFFPELLPIEQNLQRAQAQMDLLPLAQVNEGINMLRRQQFRAWMDAPDSGLLWIDGYEVPRRPSWTTDFALNIIRAASMNGHDTLFYFGSLNHDTPLPRALVQSLLFHLLQRFPAILSQGDRELFNAEIFLAAKTDLDLSWRIFVECLRLLPAPVTYLVVEGIDYIQMSDVGGDFESLLQRFQSLTSTPFEEKTVKVVLTSVRPNGGFQLLFPGHDGLEVQLDHSVLIRVPRVAARSRKERDNQLSKKHLARHKNQPSPDPPSQRAGRDDEFVPTDEEQSQGEAGNESEDDFDIFGECSENTSKVVQGRTLVLGEGFQVSNFEGTQGTPPYQSDVVLGSPVEDAANNSDSSFDIFEVKASPVVMKGAPRPESPDFAPSESDEDT
ncbi:hypothetical protein EDB81DRAFT_771821 [Dactylonectria macrodidyma]|uniref:Uncharacterized protein n=1 Tax=Dactylonectria macrodidyma TaxID=307937 RepID=A0A9P9JIY6_9HYPO|nr:hypothetical protein EDB81DRAFT_771821 [Dactylonectria macrodidyma]